MASPRKQFAESSEPSTFGSRLRVSADVLRYILVVALFTGAIFIFSLIMVAVVRSRDAVNSVRRMEVSNVYQGELVQSAPVLNKLAADSAVGKDYSQAQLEEFVKNSNIIKTKGKMSLIADFVKKGLEYEPTFRTSFEADYVLKNNLTREAAVSFEFPFPVDVENSEISNVRLVVNGEQITKAKSKINYQARLVDGLKWEGKLGSEGEATIQVSYDTVGVSGLNYQGFENMTGAQDFAMEMTIQGTRDYNLAGGLSVDKRTFGEKDVKLVWDKKNFFFYPEIHVNVGRKLAPSIQVSKVYAIMAPLYILFAGMLVWLGYKNQRKLYIRDLVLTTILFVLYFPLWHYITSFTVDPTMEFFSSWKQISYFSMSLYSGFGLAFLLVTTLLAWLYRAIYGARHMLTGLLPSVVISLGFFPLAMTIPDYSILLSLLGVVALAALWIRFRLQETV